ncbi:MAG: shikimate kinase [Bacteroidales bacterium]|jgi:shikimate kinase|nr:shikimate kinase [Bacteroidales bacterium]
MLIFIIGYMGAGKTTLGKYLAEDLNYQFHDLDEMLEISTGYTIGGYFERFGESSFRIKEQEMLISHLTDTDTVISVGGGTPCYSDNMALMNRNGLTIFIDTGVETILKRLAGKIHERPLLKHIPAARLPSFIRDHMRSRQEYYLHSAMKINGDEVDPVSFAEAVRTRIGYDKAGPGSHFT